MWVKICGITNLEDARKSLDLGADALGFNFYPPSPRYIPPEETASILRQLPKTFLSVGIFVGIPTEEEMSLVDALQIHGLEDESGIRDLDRRVLVATSPERVDRFPSFEVVIDVSWGTGKRADWNGLLRVRRRYTLSGGLTADNVGEAIRRLRPAGIDVCSGVESSPGKKDALKLEKFMNAVRTADRGPS